jgi:hypothetical protein
MKPSKDEVKTMYGHGNLGDRALLLVLVQSSFLTKSGWQIILERMVFLIFTFKCSTPMEILYLSILDKQNYIFRRLNYLLQKKHALMIEKILEIFNSVTNPEFSPMQNEKYQILR